MPKQHSNKPASAKLKRRKPVQCSAIVSCRKTASAVIKDVMFLFGVEYVADEKFEKAVNLVREKWHDGYKDGLRRSISKLKAIYAEREGS